MSNPWTRELSFLSVLVIVTLSLTIIYDSLFVNNSWQLFSQVFGGIGTFSSLFLIVKMTPILQKKVRHYSLAVWLISVGVGLMSLSYLCNGVLSLQIYENFLIGFITLILGFLLMTYSVLADTFGETL